LKGVQDTMKATVHRSI